MRPFFTTIGELLVDFMPVVESGATVGFRMHPGGSPLNVAVALARMGAQVDFAGTASTDFFGRFLTEHLNRAGVGTRFLLRSAAPTTLAFIALDRGQPSFSFYGQGAADTLLRFEDVPEEITDSAVLHFGSNSLLQAPTSETVLRVVERLGGHAVISCDPNIRASLVTDAPAYRRLLNRAFGAADLIRLSSTDLDWLMPATPLEAATSALLDLGPALVVVTLGEDGCYAAMPALHRRWPARRVSVVDTIGAGDTFTAGLLFRLFGVREASRTAIEQLTADILDDALQFATVAAALTCTRAGADPPHHVEIEAVLASWRPNETGSRP